MASSNQRALLLPPQHGENVSIVILTVHVSSLVHGMGHGQGTVKYCDQEDLQSCRFTISQSKEVLEPLPGSMKQEFPIGETPK